MKTETITITVPKGSTVTLGTCPECEEMVYVSDSIMANCHSCPFECLISEYEMLSEARRAVSPSACNVCGIECDGWKDGIRPVCPEHCEDHDYEYVQEERRHECKHCFQVAPVDWFDD